MTTPIPTGQPPLGGRDIGITYFAISGLRDTLLADVGMTFEDSLLLTALVGSDGSVTRDDLVTVLVSGLRVAAPVAVTHVDHLIASGFASEDEGTVTATPAGIEAHDRFTERVAQNAPKLYGDIPDEDLAVTRRVLATVTERANRELALTLRS